MKRPFKKYGFSQEIVQAVLPIFQAFEQDDIENGERRIAELVLEVCEKVKRGLISPKKAEHFFLLIDLYTGDNCPDQKLRREVQEILFEGMILHDYGKDYGANLDLMRELANQILGKAPG